MVSCRLPNRPNLNVRGQGVHGWPFKAEPKRDCVGRGWSLFPAATRIAFTCECRDIQQEPT